MISIKEYVEIRKKELKEMVDIMKEKPCLMVVQIGNDAASNSYIKGKSKDCQDIGIEFKHLHIDDYDELETSDIIKIINKHIHWHDPDGIMIQLPIPDKFDINKILQTVPPIKDVDGVKKTSLFDPCTPRGVVDYLKYNNYQFDGKHALVIGRSNIVGKPLADMLLNLNCTVTICHSKTSPDQLEDAIKSADIVFTCINKIEYFDGSFRLNQDIIDIGLGRGADGKLHGNLSLKCYEHMKKQNPENYIISGTGGTGLLTRLALMENVIGVRNRFREWNRGNKWTKF